jgi:hypothetical protein
LPCVSVADRKQRPEYEALKKKYESFKIINSLDEHFDQAVGILDRNLFFEINYVVCNFADFSHQS